MANLGKAVGLRCFVSTEGELEPQALAEGGFESTWCILVPEALERKVIAQGTWSRVAVPAGAPLWTDDFSSLLGVLRF